MNVNASPYHLKLTLYAYPANAGYALPFIVKPSPGTPGSLTYTVLAIPDPQVRASIVQGDIDQQATGPDGVPGNVNITVQGSWTLHLTVDGPLGQGQADVPIIATAPPAIPLWFAWIVGLIPICGFLFFLSSQWWHGRIAWRTNSSTQLPTVHNNSFDADVEKARVS